MINKTYEGLIYQMKKLPVLQISLWLCFIIHIIIIPVLLAVLYRTDITVKQIFLMSMTVFIQIFKKENIKITLPRSHCSFYLVTRVMFLAQNDVISFMRYIWHVSQILGRKWIQSNLNTSNLFFGKYQKSIFLLGDHFLAQHRYFFCIGYFLNSII